MIKFTKQLLLFKDISGKKVEADFDGGVASSDAGHIITFSFFGLPIYTNLVSIKQCAI